MSKFFKYGQLLRCKDLNVTARVVLGEILNLHNNDDWKYTLLSTLADNLGLCENTIKTAIRVLENNGLIKKYKVKALINGVEQMVNEYEPHYKAIDEMLSGQVKIASGGGSKIASGGGSKFDPNNNIYIKNTVIENNKENINKVNIKESVAVRNETPFDIDLPEQDVDKLRSIFMGKGCTDIPTSSIVGSQSTTVLPSLNCDRVGYSSTSGNVTTPHRQSIDPLDCLPQGYEPQKCVHTAEYSSMDEWRKDYDELDISRYRDSEHYAQFKSVIHYGVQHLETVEDTVQLLRRMKQAKCEYVYTIPISTARETIQQSDDDWKRKELARLIDTIERIGIKRVIDPDSEWDSSICEDGYRLQAV